MATLGRKPPKHDDHDEDAWLITYADMVTLLLCFFIIMFSLSSPNRDSITTMAQALKNFDPHEKSSPTSSVLTAEDSFSELKEQMEMALGASGYDKFIAVSKNDKFVSMELASDSFFEPGSSNFSQKGEEILQSVAKQIQPLADKKVEIEVEGHTDSAPIATAKFPSNWELSGARASSVVRYLIAQGFPKEKLRAVGYADTRPKAPNQDTAGNPILANQALNRRVVIKLLRTDDENH